MSNLIQYIIQDDPEEERRRQEKKDELLTDNDPSADKTEKKYNFSNKNLLENRESLINKSSSNSLSASENKPQTSNRQPTSNLASNPGETNTSFLPKYQKLIDQRYIHCILHRHKGKYFRQPVQVLHKKQEDRRQKYRHQIDQCSGYFQIDTGQCRKIIIICLFDHIEDRCRKYHRRW